MGTKPKLDMLTPLFAKGESFSLTDAQYEKRTGAMLPKEKNYLLKRSALAKMCRKYGYSLKLQEKIVYLEKES